MERCGLRMQLESHIFTPGNVRELIHTFPSGFSLSELESLWSLKSSKKYFRGSKFVRLKFSLYQLKVLEMSKMNLHDSSEYLKDKLWPKKGQESLCQFYSHPLKVVNHLEICMCKWCATYYWKVFDKDYIFALESPQLEVCTRSYNFPKYQKSQFREFRESQLIIENTIRGKVVSSFKFKLWWILWVRVCSCFIHAPKVLQPRTNQLVVWFM
jgi:hypothetical protein